LQADCLAGVWANRAQKKRDFLVPGDVDEALQTTSAIGDDRLQKPAARLRGAG
jgi:predicted metalloprotease